MDRVSKQKRSEIMSRVKNKNSKIEIIFRKELWKRGFRYRKNSNKYFGTPDMVLPKYKTVIFIDSCFWHGCKQHLRIPNSNKNYWVKKIQRNKRRDQQVTLHHVNNHWKVIRIWEHELMNAKYLEKQAEKIMKVFNNCDTD